jgi:hypothetical protein
LTPDSASFFQKGFAVTQPPVRAFDASSLPCLESPSIIGGFSFPLDRFRSTQILLPLNIPSALYYSLDHACDVDAQHTGSEWAMIR